jgi:hypothetical protein
VVATENKKQSKSIKRERREQIRTGGRRKEDTGRHEEKVTTGGAHNLVTCISPSIAQVVPKF